MKVFIKVILTVTTFLIFYSCNTTDPKLEAELLLKLEDISCTEAWLQLTTNNIQLPTTINVLKNNYLSHSFVLNTQDSLIYIDSLLPNQNYSFQASSIQNPESSISSNELSVSTMDTTNHNFSAGGGWQTFTFGERTSTLYDVAIIDENNIWAVGEIYTNDSLGNPDPTSYNAVHWNGRIWELKKIGGYGGWPCRTVFAFAENDVWFEGVIRWDGVNYTIHKNGFPLEPNGDGWQINKMWGSSNNDLYAVGNNGNIAHYNGSSWTKIESGTTTALTDVYGDGVNVFICGYEDFKPTVLLKYENNIVKKIVEEIEFNYSKDFISGWVKSIWVKREKLFSLTFYDLYRSSVNTKGEAKAIWQGDVNIWGSNAVRGNDVNDLFTAGYNAVLWHYNGLGWKRYEELVNPTNHFRVISITGNTVVVAGFKYLNGIDRYGLITIGRR